MMAFSQARSANAVPAVPPAVPAMHAHAQLPVADPAATLEDRLRRKRKADTQDTNNERLNKRMSLLNLSAFPTYLTYLGTYLGTYLATCRPSPRPALPSNVASCLTNLPPYRA